jgi:hypothetical protein
MCSLYVLLVRLSNAALKEINLVLQGMKLTTLGRLKERSDEESSEFC